MCQMQIAEIARLFIAGEREPWLASTKAVVFGQRRVAKCTIQKCLHRSLRLTMTSAFEPQSNWLR